MSVWIIQESYCLEPWTIHSVYKDELTGQSKLEELMNAKDPAFDFCISEYMVD